jgi:hypothetical protein
VNKQNSELERFNAAMDKLLKANPAAVKAAMEQEKKQREQRRKAKKADNNK